MTGIFSTTSREWILELEEGHAFPYKGKLRSLAAAEAGSNADQKQPGGVAAESAWSRKLAWVRLNPAGRQAKSKARIKRYEELAAKQVDTREDTLTSRSRPVRGWATSGGGRESDQGLWRSHPHGERQFQPAARRDRGVIGANGAGKTTLFKDDSGAGADDLRQSHCRPPRWSRRTWINSAIHSTEPHRFTKKSRAVPSR